MGRRWFYAGSVPVHSTAGPQRKDRTMTLLEAVAAAEATFAGATHLRVDRRQARQDESAYLLLVLDTAAGRRTDDGPVLNGPRLVSKLDGTVTRPTVPEALALAARMDLVRS